MPPQSAGRDMGSTRSIVISGSLGRSSQMEMSGASVAKAGVAWAKAIAARAELPAIIRQYLLRSGYGLIPVPPFPCVQKSIRNVSEQVYKKNGRTLVIGAVAEIP